MSRSVMLSFGLSVSVAISPMLSTTAVANGYANHYTNAGAYETALTPESDAYAGVYFRLPLQKRYGSNKRQMNYGLALGFRRTGFTSSAPVNFQSHAPKMIQINLLDVTFNEQGFKTFNVAALPLLASAEHKTIWQLMDDEKKSGGTHTAVWVLAGLGALVVVGAVAYTVSPCSRPLSGFDESCRD